MACKMGVVGSCACSACFGCALLTKMIVGSIVGVGACSEDVSGEVFVHPLEGALRQPLQHFGDGGGVHVCNRNVSAAEQCYVSLSLPHRVSAPPFRSYDRKQTQRVNGAVSLDPRGILGGKRIKERTYHT